MKHSHLYLAIGIAVSGLFIASCDKKEDESNVAAQQQQPPSVVNVMPVQFQTVPLIKEFSGRTTAYEVADVRPQVTGVVDEIMYHQGSMVKKGQPLYRLSADNYQSGQGVNEAALQQAEANVETAKASYNNAMANIASRKAEYEQAIADLNRISPLLDMKAISEQQVQQAQTRVKTAQAALASAQANAQQAQANIASSQAAVNTAKAQLSSSQLDLNRTIVRAPISGITERSNVTVGALVNANQAEPLVTITKLDPIYVEFNLSSAELLQIKNKLANGALQPGDTQVELILEDGTTYPIRGQLSLAEAKVNQDTGSVTWRATFPNKNYLLLPGMYAKARIIQGLINNAVLMPQSALIRTPKGEAQVYIVDKDNKVQVRPVELSGTYQGKWVISDGLNLGDKVVVIGGATLRPDTEVNPKPYTPSIDDNSQPNPVRGPLASGTSNPSASKPVMQKPNQPDGSLSNQANNSKDATQ